MNVAKAMQYEEMPLKISRSALKEAARDFDVRKMNTSSVLWYLAVKHKFGLLLTFTIVFVAFSLFGQLIVGLFESL